MYSFGAGVAFATPTTDAYGAVIAHPTPLMFMTTQDVEIDFKFDTKELFGQNQFAVAIGRGKGAISGKIKSANIISGMLETVVFGQAGTAGLMSVRQDTVGTTIAATVTPSSSFIADLGVISATTGQPYTRVPSAPATGQYSVAAGVYTFAAADVGKVAYINFRYTTAALAGARQIALKSLPMGYAPTFRLDQYAAYQGESLLFSFNNCVADGIKFGFKNDDFTIPDMGFKICADAGGNIGTISILEA
jgi:hypothetical protein